MATKPVAFRLDEKLFRRLDVYAKKKGSLTPGVEFSRVDAVRFLLTHALNDWNWRIRKQATPISPSAVLVFWSLHSTPQEK
jgi:hypothetical protein